MLLRLSPTLVRSFGHAVHRAPDTERNQHPGDGAAGHYCAMQDTRISQNVGTGGPCAKWIVLRRDGEKSSPLL